MGPDIGRRGSRGVLTTASVLVTGLSGYAALAVVGRQTDSATYADFLALWGVLFGLFMVAGGIGLQTAASLAPHGVSTGATLTRNIIVLVPTGAAMAAVLGLAAGQRFDLSAGGMAVVLGVAIGGYLVQTAVLGGLAGAGRTREYSWLLIVEAILRLALVGGVALSSPGLLGLGLAIGFAAWSWLGFVLAVPAVREVLGARVGSDALTFCLRAASAAAASIAPAVLVVGFPYLVKLLVSPDVYSGAAGVLLAVILTRAPLLVPLAVVQPVLVAWVARHEKVPGRLLAGLVALGTIATPVAALVGPDVAEWISPAVRVPGWVFAALVVDAILLAALTVLAASCLARGMRGTYMVAWWSATLLTAAALVAPLDLDDRIVVGLAMGPAVAAIICVVALRWRSSGRAVAESGPADGLVAPPV